MTLRQFAQAIGVSPSHLGNAESGSTGVGAAPLIECSAQFGISLDWLKAGIGEMNVSADERVTRMRRAALELRETAPGFGRNTVHSKPPADWPERVKRKIDQDREKIQYALDVGTPLEAALAKVGREIQEER